MASSKKKQSNGSDQAGASSNNSNGKQLDNLAAAAELLKDISGKTVAIRDTMKALATEKAQLESDFKARVKEIDKQIGRLNSYLLRLEGGIAVPVTSNGSSNGSKANGKPRRLTAEDAEKLQVQVIELASRHGKEGLKRGDVMEALDVSPAHASRVLSELEQAKRLKAEGERAGRRYFLGD